MLVVAFPLPLPALQVGRPGSLGGRSIPLCQPPSGLDSSPTPEVPRFWQFLGAPVTGDSSPSWGALCPLVPGALPWAELSSPSERKDTGESDLLWVEAAQRRFHSGERPSRRLRRATTIPSPRSGRGTATLPTRRLPGCKRAAGRSRRGKRAKDWKRSSNQRLALDSSCLVGAPDMLVSPCSMRVTQVAAVLTSSRPRRRRTPTSRSPSSTLAQTPRAPGRHRARQGPVRSRC